MKEITNRFLIWCAVFAVIIGVFLRIASFSWNSALNGDVNLFALTAREFTLHGRLDYPMKYEFSDRVDYLTLHTPASQHPPLWPLSAGIIAKIIGADDTFAILKILSEICGGLLIGAIALSARISSDNTPKRLTISESRINITAISLVSLSAILVDFSANGSPYILMALWLTLSYCLLLRFKPQKFTHLLTAGLLCVASILTHSAMLLLPLGFIFAILTNKSSLPQTSTSKTLKTRLWNVVVFLLVILVGLSPWLFWNLRQFGQIFHSYSSNYIYEQLGLMHTGIYGNVITSRLEYTLPALKILPRYALLAAKSMYALCREMFLLIGPFGLILSLFGLVWGYKTNKDRITPLLIPIICYVAAIGIWATYKFRFLTPIIPAYCFLVSFGFFVIFSKGGFWRWFAGLCLTGAFIWSIIPIFQDAKTMYYGRESHPHNALYAEMQPLAISLATRQPGVVLGYSQYLDGGIETVYWHRFPFVAGRGMSEMEIKKLAADFNFRYIWADTTSAPTLQQWFPAANVIDRSGEFVVLELVE